MPKRALSTQEKLLKLSNAAVKLLKETLSGRRKTTQPMLAAAKFIIEVAIKVEGRGSKGSKSYDSLMKQIFEEKEGVDG